MAQRARVASYRDAVAAAGAAEIRMAMTTQDAVELAGELAAGEARHADALAAGLAALAEVGQAPTDVEAIIEWGRKRAAAADQFWDAFEGQVVDGVEIVRRRA